MVFLDQTFQLLLTRINFVDIMKLIISICAFVLFILSAQAGYCQKEIDVSGNKYLLHKVEKGETTFGICQQFKITPAELIAANPEISAGLKTGASLKIPVKGVVSSEQPKQVSPKANTGEPEYYYHKVFKNQTIFSIARQYNITANDLVKYNPILTNGLVPGTILKIPVKLDDGKAVASASPKAISATAPQPAPVKEEAGFTIHTVAAGETLYRLQNTYGVTLEELTALNPSLVNGLKTGSSIKIPVKKQQEEAPASASPSTLNAGILAKQDDSTDCMPITGKNKQKYKVALLLPLYLSGNDQVQPSQLNAETLLGKVDFSKINNQWYTGSTDSVAPANTTVIDPKAVSFLEFYEGALLAIDSLQQLGMNVELCVFDASNLNMINALLQLDVFRSLDLIIGPVYPELQETVASFAAKNRIPMVSPLANTGNFEENNPYYFKVNPSRDYQVEQSAKYIASEFKAKNFVLLKMNGNNASTEAKVANLGSEKLLNAKQQEGGAVTLYHEYSFQQQGLHGIKSLLDNTAENIFMIPTDDEAQVSVAVTNLNALAEHYNVVLMGTSNFPKMKSIQTENYHRIQLRYLASTFVDYNQPLVRRFIGNYRGIFSDEPTQFSFQGYDVSYYFLSALYRYGKNFRNCLPEYPMKLTQNNFNFRMVTPMGGYMNHSLFVTSYERNFDVNSLGTVGSETK
jgi:LysM repeat protein/ABC-type branched-subunit amino acid transport system substrate-binding protein